MTDIEDSALRLLDALDHLVEDEALKAWDEGDDSTEDQNEAADYAEECERERRAEMDDLLRPVHQAVRDLIRDALIGDVPPRLWSELHRHKTHDPDLKRKVRR